MQTLKIGSISQDVVLAKGILAAQGFWTLDKTATYTTEFSRAVAKFQQTHNAENGNSCVVDGNIGPETWWALNHSSGEGQPTLCSNELPSGICGMRAKVLQVALSNVGIKEIPDGSNRGNRPNGGVDKFLPDWCKKPGEKGPSWCAFFVSYVTNEAFGHYPLGKRMGSCKEAFDVAKRSNMTYTDKLLVTPGDAFVMMHDAVSGHIGFVYYVNSDGSIFNTIEGNCGNMVKIGKRSHKDIFGFINFYGEANVKFERKLLDAPDVGKDGTR